MQAPPTATGTEAVSARRNNIDRLSQVLSTLGRVYAIIGAGGLIVGFAITCQGEDCHDSRIVFLSLGAGFLTIAACFLVVVIVLQKMTRRATRLDQSNSAMQPVTFPPGYLSQPVIDFPTVATQYPPPYDLSTGSSNNPLSPAANQYPSPDGFTASPQPTKSCLQEEPPPYSP